MSDQLWLLFGEPEPTAGDPFIAQLAALCRDHPARAKWVFVPTHALGFTIGERLARQSGGWANLRFVTPLDIAIRMAGPFLVERGIDPSEEPLGPALVMRLLADLPGSHTYFRPMAEHTTLAVALWSTLKEMRFAGLGASDLAAVPEDAFESRAKRDELLALLEAYERHLASAHVADMATVFAEAVKDARFCPVQPADCWIELPDIAWPPLVRRFLDRLPGERLAPRGLLLAGLDVPGRVAVLGARAARVAPEVASDASRLAFLRAPTEAGPARRDGSLAVFHAGGRDAEIEEAFRRILASGRRLDEAEIVCSSDEHLWLAWEKARRLGWPVTVSRGLPAATTRPGRALLGWCAWIDGGFAASDLRRLLLSNDIAPAALARAADGLSTNQAARLLLRAETAWGRQSYACTLAAFAAREEARASGDDDAEGGWRRQRAAHARALLAWVEDLLDDVPAPRGDGLVEMTDVLDAASRFLDANASRGSDLDAAALVAIADAVSGLRALGSERRPLSLALRYLGEGVEGLRIGAGRPQPGSLHVSSLVEPGFEARPLVFVVGLEEGRVFPAAVEDPVLLDGERQAIATRLGIDRALRVSSDRIDEAVFAAVSRLARLGLACERIVLSFSCVDTREFRETFPSWLVLQAHRLAEGRPEADYASLRASLGEPRSAVPRGPDDATTGARWWLGAGRADPAVAGAVADAFPSLARGLAASRARESDAFTAHDGLVPAAGAVLDPTRNGRAISPTALEDIAKCPFRFFLKSGLGLEAIEDDERDTDVWLDPMRRGSELHALYALLTRRARDEQRRVSRARDLQWLLERGRARLEDLREEMPPPSAEVYAAESAELLHDLETFVEAEEELREVEPVAFEVSFGRPLDDAAEPLASVEPAAIAVDGSRQLALAGRIDRIDRVGPAADHAYQVLDYKTGRFWPADYAGTFVGGRLLQHALYGQAAEALLRRIDRRARVVQGVYWFPTGRGWGRRVVIRAPSSAELRGVLGDLVEIIATGAFTHAPEERECGRCDFRAACGREPWIDAERKVATNLESRLDAWIRLKERG
jgi:ATP-dependent helicase/nuclease subunit B